MGTGSLSDEMQRLANLLVSAGASARQAMQLHLQVLEEMVEGLGSRSARHVMNRADLLVLDIMIHLIEGYRHRCQAHDQAPLRYNPLAGDDRPGEADVGPCLAQSNERR
jgi:hypothetical protein